MCLHIYIYIFFYSFIFFLFLFFSFSHEAVGGSRRAASLHSRYLINIGAEGNDVLASAVLFFRFLKFSYVHRKSGGKQIFLFPSPPFSPFFPLFSSFFLSPTGGERGRTMLRNPGRVTSLRTFFEPRFRAQPRRLRVEYLSCHAISNTNITTDSKIISFPRGPISGSLRMNETRGQKVTAPRIQERRPRFHSGPRYTVSNNVYQGEKIHF